jgi:hypothetical protein
MQNHDTNLCATCSIAALALLSIVPTACAAEQTNRLGDVRADEERRLGNERLELRFERNGSLVSSRQLDNKLSRRTIPLSGDGFSLGIDGRASLHSADFAFQAAREEAIAGGRRLTFQFKNGEPAARLDVIYELGGRDFLVRRRKDNMGWSGWENFRNLIPNDKTNLQEQE